MSLYVARFFSLPSLSASFTFILYMSCWIRYRCHCRFFSAASAVFVTHLVVVVNFLVKRNKNHLIHVAQSLCLCQSLCVFVCFIYRHSMRTKLGKAFCVLVRFRRAQKWLLLWPSVSLCLYAVGVCFGLCQCAQPAACLMAMQNIN